MQYYYYYYKYNETSFHVLSFTFIASHASPPFIFTSPSSLLPNNSQSKDTNPIHLSDTIVSDNLPLNVYFGHRDKLVFSRISLEITGFHNGITTRGKWYTQEFALREYERNETKCESDGWYALYVSCFFLLPDRNRRFLGMDTNRIWIDAWDFFFLTFISYKIV